MARLVTRADRVPTAERDEAADGLWGDLGLGDGSDSSRVGSARSRSGSERVSPLFPLVHLVTELASKV